MKAMEIDSSQWTDEMRQNAVKKLEELGYVRYALNKSLSPNNTGRSSITSYNDGEYGLYDKATHNKKTTTYEELMSLTKEDVQ